MAEIIKASELQQNKERLANIDKITDWVMEAIKKANDSGKRKTRYDTVNGWDTYHNTTMCATDYPEVQKKFEDAGYWLERENIMVYGGRTVEHIYICW